MSSYIQSPITSSYSISSDPNFNFHVPSVTDVVERSGLKKTWTQNNTSNGGTNIGKSQALSAVTNLVGGYAYQDYDPLQQGVKQGINSAMMNSGNPWLMGAAAINMGMDAAAEAGNFNNQNIKKSTAKTLDLSKGAVAGNYIVNMIPGLSAIAGAIGAAAGNRFNGVKQLQNSEKLGASHSGLLNTANAWDSLKKNGVYAFGGKELNRKAKTYDKLVEDANEITYNSKRMESNYAPQLIAANNHMIFNGYTPGLTLRKHGGTIPELEEVRTIMQSLQSKKQDIQEPQKFQLGGKMNMIVTGALHARKHNLEELNPNLEGEITKKGIPVVVMNEGGEVQSQQAEVESQELVLQIDTTKTIEDYYNEYNSTDSKTEKNKVAFECGKYLVDELLKNTDDPDKLIKKTV